MLPHFPSVSPLALVPTGFHKTFPDVCTGNSDCLTIGVGSQQSVSSPQKVQSASQVTQRSTRVLLVVFLVQYEKEGEKQACHQNILQTPIRGISTAECGVDAMRVVKKGMMMDGRVYLGPSTIKQLMMLGSNIYWVRFHENLSAHSSPLQIIIGREQVIMCYVLHRIIISHVRGGNLRSYSFL